MPTIALLCKCFVDSWSKNERNDVVKQETLKNITRYQVSIRCMRGKVPHITQLSSHT